MTQEKTCKHGYIKKFGCLLCTPKLEGKGSHWAMLSLKNNQTLGDFKDSIKHIPDHCRISWVTLTTLGKDFEEKASRDMDGGITITLPLKIS